MVTNFGHVDQRKDWISVCFTKMKMKIRGGCRDMRKALTIVDAYKHTRFASRYWCWVLVMVRLLTSVWRGLLSISLDLHTAGDSAVGFPSWEISDVNERVVCGGQQVHDSEDVDVGSSAELGWTEVGLLFFLHFDFFLGSLFKTKKEWELRCSF